MTDIPNCSNCSQHCDLYETGKHTRRQLMQYFTEANGCLFHPRAREWLMRDEIKELEEMLSNAENTHEMGTHQRRAALKQAITLIRNGVNKG